MNLKYDLKRLDAATAPYERLAAFLKMTDLEFPRQSRQAVHAAENVLNRDADCVRAFDVICSNGGLSDLHRATVMAPQSFQHFFRAKLAAVPDLPDHVRKALGRQADDRALDAALIDAGRAVGDPGDLSWGVLAKLARENRFIQVERRLAFMTGPWSVSARDYWGEARPLVAEHPLRPFLGALAGKPEDVQEFQKLAEDFDSTDLLPTEHELCLRLGRLRPAPELNNPWGRACSHGGENVGDVARSFGDQHPNRVSLSNLLTTIAPYSPYPRALLVRYDWEKSKERLDEWQKDYGDSPAFLLELGRKLLELKRFDQARPVWEKYIEVANDPTGYEQLADCYEGLGDDARWLETLNAYLKDADDSGLDRARVEVKVAQHHLKHGAPEKAKSYSDAAAATWASWAMSCAAEVDERLGAWDEAEQWHRRNSTRYPSVWPSWYLFCRRTGRGDLKAAQALAHAMLRNPEVKLPLEQRAYFHWMEGEPDEAIRNLETALAEKAEPSYALPLALLYDHTGAVEKRDALLKRVVEEMKDKAPKTIVVFDMLRGSLTDPSLQADLSEVDAYLDSMPPVSRDFARFLVGRFFLNRGDHEVARKYLDPFVASPTAGPWARAAAAVWLREAFPDRKPKPESKPAPDRTSA